MPVVRIRPTLTKTTETTAKLSAYGVVNKPTTAPTYPITVAQVNGKGRYEILVVGNGDSTATINVYVDGATTPTDSITSDTPAKIEGAFNSSVAIRIEGSGLHSTIAYAVFTEATVLRDVTVS